MDTTTKGDALEDAIYDLFDQIIDDDLFFCKKECCRLFRKKGYYSKDRQSKIIFDVSIEVTLPGETDYSFVYLIECKNYSSSVPASDIEEFYAKVQQVAAANSKAVIATNASVQTGGLAFMQSKGIGLLRYFGDTYKWQLKRSASGWYSKTLTTETQRVQDALLEPTYESEYFDCYCYAPHLYTNSLSDFFNCLTMYDASADVARILARCSNSRKSLVPQIDYLAESQIESRATEVLESVNYTSGPLNLKDICNRQKEEIGLVVRLDNDHQTASRDPSTLGFLSFEPPQITIFSSTLVERDRFTLAHELGHLFLDHARYMKSEYTKEDDLDNSAPQKLALKQLGRLEWQANYFASCLLLPVDSITREFYLALHEFDIRDKGWGPLFVDRQRDNQHNYYSVTDLLKNKFQVSRQALDIRLGGLGLLNDARHFGASIGEILRQS